MSDVQVYHVVHRIERSNYSDGSGDAVIVKGDTTFEDLRKMIAIRRGVNTEEVTIIGAILKEG